MNILQLQLSAQPSDLLQSPWEGNSLAWLCLCTLPGAAVLYLSKNIYHDENILHFMSLTKFSSHADVYCSCNLLLRIS